MKKKILGFLTIIVLIIITIPSINGCIVKKSNNINKFNQEIIPLELIINNKEKINDLDLKYEYINREKIIDIAEAYANYEWYPTFENIFHGNCPICGMKVHTTDRDYYTEWYDFWGWKAGQLNIGVPYKAGGFSSISGFNLTNPEDFYEQYTGTGVYEGSIHYGGDTYINKQYSCSRACGVDCSGFVSRCWNLPIKHCTFPYEEYPFGLQNVSSPIRYNELKPGDLINSPKYHSILFKEFVDDDTITIIDAGGLAWQVAEYPCNITFISDDSFKIRLEGSYHNLTFDFSDQIFRPRQYNFISNTPTTPIIQGPAKGKKGMSYNYSFVATDPDGDDIYYIIEWGDNKEEIGPTISGEIITINHTWAENGLYQLRAKSKDINGLESGWSELEITLSRYRTINPSFLTILQNYLIFYQIFQRFLKL